MAGNFREGDHVRLGILRGGVVLRVDGRLRVQFPHSARLLWLEFIVPDEGPDGTIDPNTWNTCQRCDNPTLRETFCLNCDGRDEAELDAFDRTETRREHRAKAIGIHVASAIRRDGRAMEQRCVRCGLLLHRVLGTLPIAFVEGALVERDYLGIALAPKHVTEATCTPVRELVGAH